MTALLQTPTVQHPTPIPATLQILFTKLPPEIVPMNLKLLLVMLVLFLIPGCGHSVRDDLPASDLTALYNSVSRDLKPRTLPNGKIYCAELAKTEQAQDECLGDLEDFAYDSNEDKARADRTLHTGIQRLKLQRDPCRWYEARCKWNARKLNNLNRPEPPITPPE